MAELRLEASAELSVPGFKIRIAAGRLILCYLKVLGNLPSVMPNKRPNPDFLNGVPELLILKLLSRRPMHGYELVQALRAATGDALEFGEGCVYPILHRLEADGMLKCRREMASGRNRLVYRVTARGEQRLAESVSLWMNVTQAITRALRGSDNVEVQLA